GGRAARDASGGATDRGLGGTVARAGVGGFVDRELGGTVDPRLPGAGGGVVDSTLGGGGRVDGELGGASTGGALSLAPGGMLSARTTETGAVSRSATASCAARASG